MASSIMMQSMCNNQQNNDLGTYGSQYNQVNYGPFDATYATSPALTPDFAGGMFATSPGLATSPALSLPPLNYAGGISPQMVPLGFPAISPPMMPLVDMNVSSVSPPMSAPLGLLPPVPMMGYSMIPVPQGNMTMVGLPQPQASGSMPSESFFLAVSPGSISRSCSPAMSEELLTTDFSTGKQEITRERLPSSASVASIASTDSAGTISKKELVENCLNQIDQIFGERVQTTGMRGPTVMRIKVKTRPALELIVDLLRTLEQQCNIIAISCPKSTKKGKQHIRGFLAYIQTSTVAEIDQVQSVFDAFNLAHTAGDAAPFKTLEVNPQKKN